MCVLCVSNIVSYLLKAIARHRANNFIFIVIQTINNLRNVYVIRRLFNYSSVYKKIIANFKCIDMFLLLVIYASIKCCLCLNYSVLHSLA